MNNELQIFKNQNLNLQIRAIKNDDGSISANLEDAARGLGFIQTKNKKVNPFYSGQYQLHLFCRKPFYTFF